jgi:polyisoprenoid-binding protein YceI
MKVPLMPIRNSAKAIALGILALFAPLQLIANEPVNSAKSTATSTLDYRLDTRRSNVTAKVSFFALASKTARFPEMAGTVRIVPDRPEAARIDVTFDATAIEAPDDTTLKRLRGNKFFWVEKYPQVRFVGENLTLSDARNGIVRGKLTARGVTRPATLKVVFDNPPLTTPRGQAITLTGTTTIDRREFGMKSYQLVVGNDVDITLTARMLPN